jgi:hypothetical protein
MTIYTELGFHLLTPELFEPTGLITHLTAGEKAYSFCGCLTGLLYWCSFHLDPPSIHVFPIFQISSNTSLKTTLLILIPSKDPTPQRHSNKCGRVMLCFSAFEKKKVKDLNSSKRLEGVFNGKLSFV